MRKVCKSIVVSIALMASLSGCITAQTVPASPAVAQAAVNRELPPPDRARVFIATGRNPMFITGEGPMVRHNLPADIYVDNVKIGSVNPEEVMVLDVAPGSYTFTWMVYNQKIGWGETMRPGIFDLRGGTITSLSADKVYDTFYVSQGMVASLFEPGGARLAAKVKVVRPALCPPTLCL